MKPDFIGEFDSKDFTDPVPEPEPEPHPTIVVSCISQLEEKQLEKFSRLFPRILERLPYINLDEKESKNCYLEYIRSAYQRRFAFVCIVLPEKIFSIKNLRDFRKTILWLCGFLQTDSCTLIFNLKELHFFKEMLSNNYLKNHPDYEDKINKQFESIKNGSHEESGIEIDIQGLSFYLCNNLLIRNLDVPIPLPINVLDYASIITNKGINNNFPYPKDVIHHMMFFKGIKPNIPILLRKDMPEYKELWKDLDDSRKVYYIPQGTVLGYYTKYDEENFCKGPHIVLGPEIIKKSSEEKSISFEVLFTKVLIHELAHAMMDNSNNWPSSLEAKAMEESLANKITLNWFRLFAPNEFKYAVSHPYQQQMTAVFLSRHYCRKPSSEPLQLSSKSFSYLLILIS